MKGSTNRPVSDAKEAVRNPLLVAARSMSVLGAALMVEEEQKNKSRNADDDDGGDVGGYWSKGQR